MDQTFEVATDSALVSDEINDTNHLHKSIKQISTMFTFYVQPEDIRINTALSTGMYLGRVQTHSPSLISV